MGAYHCKCITTKQIPVRLRHTSCQVQVYYTEAGLATSAQQQVDHGLVKGLGLGLGYGYG
jgi:hypothetical protein